MWGVENGRGKLKVSFAVKSLHQDDA